jgi:hypothetical protein
MARSMLFNILVELNHSMVYYLYLLYWESYYEERIPVVVQISLRLALQDGLLNIDIKQQL